MADNLQQSPSGFKPIPSYLRWIAFGVGVAMFALAIGVYLGLTNVVIGIHESSAKWLPVKASDICFYRSYDYTAFEFNIPEADFLAWCKSNDWETKPLEKPTKIGRYIAGPKLQPKPPDEPPDHTATKGLIFERLFKEGREEGIRVIYDSEQERAYYTWMPSPPK